MSKTVGIVGAGVSGLVAIKICLEEGLLPTCFEKSSTIGGLWNYDEENALSSSGRVYKSMVANICKVNMAYSDFPMPVNTPPFPSHEEYLQYLHEYAVYFKLKKHIQMRTEVIKIEKAADYNATGRWTIHFRQEGKETLMQTFDFVMICSGYFTNPIIPEYPSLDEFTGTILHTAQYRKREQFANKKVIVIGNSVSGIDVAADVSFAAEQVFLSLRNAFWLMKKNGPGGYPYDLYLLNRFNRSFSPAWLRQYLFETFFQIDANFEALGIRSDRPIFTTDRGNNDYLLGQLMNGKVKITAGVKRFMSNGVEFVDGTKLNNLDAVIFGTGYTVTTAFIDDSLVPDDLDTRDLYKYIFPVRLPHSTLACIGLFSLNNNASMVSELQCRWSVQAFKGSITLPSRNEMKEDIAQKLQDQKLTFGKVKHFKYFKSSNFPFKVRKVRTRLFKDGKNSSSIELAPFSPDITASFFIQVNGAALCDELANELGCYPSIKRFLLTDPRLALKLMFGPITPSSYRLIGSRRWSGARQAVMNSWEDSLSGLSGKIVKKDNSFLKFFLLFAVLLILFKTTFIY